MPADEAVLKGAGQRAVDVAARGRADRRRAGQAVDPELVRRRWRRSLDPPRLAAAPPRGWNAIHLYEAARWHGTLARRSRSRGRWLATAPRASRRSASGLESHRSQARRRRAGGRRGRAQARRLMARRAAGEAAREATAGAMDRARPADHRQSLPAASVQPVRDARPRLHPRARTPRVSPARHGADQPPQVPPIRGDLARHPRVSPKVASKPMGRKTPEYQPGAASITLRRYTHTLPGELERARDLLEAFRAPPRPLCTRRSHVPLQGARGRSCRNPESLHLASRRVIAFVVQSSHRGLSPWRPSAGRSTGGASRDAVGLLTPPLLLRREHGHQAPSDRGFRSGTTSRSDSSRVVVGSFVIWMQKSCREPVSAQNKGRTPASVARRASSPRRRST